MKADKVNSWVTDGAWISGVLGASCVLLLAAWFNVSRALEKGVHVLGVQLSSNRIDTLLLALLIISSVMVVGEIIRLYCRSRDDFFSIHPKIRSGRYVSFVLESLQNYFFYVVLLYLVILFFHSAGEYGFKRQAAYYQAWFRLLDWVFEVYVWGGFFYVLITRALKYNEVGDALDYGYFVQRLILTVFYKVSKKNIRTKKTTTKNINYSKVDAKIARGLMVKLFFTPLMTIFFVEQFPHLVSNVGYIFGGLPRSIMAGTYSLSQFNKDIFNISISVIFSIDVALAWCGYMVSSRWVDNQTISAEPSTLGWVVCLICYPPFQMFLGLYYSAPGEKEAIYLFDQQWMVSIFLILMVLSYFVYMFSTLSFGVRFSNLTHRGIIRKGPFSVVRHPAYASKNFAWWCIMFPAIVYNAFHVGFSIAVTQVAGLLLMTCIYYWRAITEEQHLCVDPQYKDYCKQVPYRFIPKVY